MNAEVYLFGDLGEGYTQYIDDSTRTLFRSMVGKAKANSQLIIYREDTLMYYTYIRRLRSAESSNRYIGISYALNNRFISDFDGLFSIFEGAVTTIVFRGVILEYTYDGNITSSLGKIHKAKSEFTQISAYLKAELDSFMAGKNDTLPLLDYSINTSETKSFRHTDSKAEIIKALSTFPNVIIVKDNDYESAESKNYAATLHRLNKENTDLKKANRKLTQQKKQIKVVAWLSVIIAVGVVIFFFIIQTKNDIIQTKNDDISNLTQRNNKLTIHVENLKSDSIKLTSDLQSTKNQLRISNNRVNALRSDSTKFVRRVDSCYTAISTLKLEKENAVKRARKVENDFKSFKTNLASNPLIIYDVEIGNQYADGTTETAYGGYIYSSRSMYLAPKIKYVGLNSGYATLKVKFYTPDGTLSKGSKSPYDCSYTNSVYVYSGKNEYSLSGWGNSTMGHWRKGSYKIEIWYNSTLLATKIFTIY